MENASKALVIAGAILISILLISIGVFIINSISSTQAQMEDTMDTQARDTFNSVYTAYVGTQSGSNVKSLLNKVATNNSKTDAAHKISINNDIVDSGAISTYAASILSTKNYVVSIKDYDNGYIKNISIVEK